MQRTITRYFIYFYSLLIFCGSLQAMDNDLSEIVMPAFGQNEDFIDEEERLASNSFRDSTEENCPICLDLLSSRTLDCCNTQFHQPCIERWAEKKPTCPCCRKELPQDLLPREDVLQEIEIVDQQRDEIISQNGPRRATRGEKICLGAFCTFLVAVVVVPITVFVR